VQHPKIIIIIIIIKICSNSRHPQQQAHAQAQQHGWPKGGSFNPQAQTILSQRKDSVKPQSAPELDGARLHVCQCVSHDGGGVGILGIVVHGCARDDQRYDCGAVWGRAGRQAAEAGGREVAEAAGRQGC
jgi:hypothetical protein